MTARPVADTFDLVTAGDLGDDVRSFAQALKRESASPNTIAAYALALRELAEFLAAHEYTTDVRRIEARYIDEWLVDLLERHKPATAHNRFRGAQRFFKWYAETNDSFASPMRRMRPPGLPQYERVFELDQQKKLVRACRGPAFEDQRDMALVRLFFNTSARRAEIASLRYSATDREDRDLDLHRRTVRIVGKSRRERIVSLTNETVAALDAYMRARRGHPHADLPWLWLGKAGRLTDSTVGRALWNRGMRAGIPDLHRLGHGLWIVKSGVPRGR